MTEDFEVQYLAEGEFKTGSHFCNWPGAAMTGRMGAQDQLLFPTIDPELKWLEGRETQLGSSQMGATEGPELAGSGYETHWWWKLGTREEQECQWHSRILGRAHMIDRKD